MTEDIRILRSDRACLPDSVRDALHFLVFVPEVRAIILFGSRAVGDNDEKSDFDISVSAPSLARNKFSKLRDTIAHSRTLYKISISLLEAMPERLQKRIT